MCGSSRRCGRTRITRAPSCSLFVLLLAVFLLWCVQQSTRRFRYLCLNFTFVFLARNLWPAHPRPQFCSALPPRSLHAATDATPPLSPSNPPRCPRPLPILTLPATPLYPHTRTHAHTHAHPLVVCFPGCEDLSSPRLRQRVRAVGRLGRVREGGIPLLRGGGHRDPAAIGARRRVFWQHRGAGRFLAWRWRGEREG